MSVDLIAQHIGFVERKDMRILVILPRLPGHISDGGDLWAATVIGSLSRNGHDVHLIGYGAPQEIGGANVHAIKFGEFRSVLIPFHALRWGLYSLFANRPYTVQKWKTRRFADALQAMLAEGRWDLAMVYGTTMSWTVPLLDIPFIHISSEPVHVLYGLTALIKRWPLSWVFAREARLLTKAEGDLARASVETWCITKRDAALYEKLGAVRPRVLSPVCRPDWEDLKVEDAGEHDLVMLGNWIWRPNHLALQEFLERVVPLLPPSWRIVVGGRVPRRRIKAPSNVRFVGLVHDACAFLRSGRRIAVPSTSAVGLNTKLLDAIAAGRPVVASTAALTLAGPVPDHVRGASDPASFAAALMEAPEPDLEESRRWMAARRVALDQAVIAGLNLGSSLVRN